MKRARTWAIMLNLDRLNGAYPLLRDASDKAEFLDGMFLGLNGGELRGEESKPFRVAFDLGSESRAETEAYRQRQSENGRKGGRPRRDSDG